MTKSRRVVLLLLAFALVSRGAAAEPVQRTPILSSGLRAASTWDRDTAGPAPIALPTQSSTSSPNHAIIRGALIGAAAGGITGGVLGYQIDSTEVGRISGNTISFGLLGAGAGAAVGALVGWLLR